MTDGTIHHDEDVARPGRTGTGPPAAGGADADDHAVGTGADGAGPRRRGGTVRDRAADVLDRFATRPIDEMLAGFVTFGIVAAGVALTLFVLDPSNLLSDTTPAGGDMGAHVWGPAFLRDQLLPSGRLTGWTMDWYAGFPAYHFYMVVPSLLIAIGSWFVPYGVAFKLVAVSGCVTFPVACWFLGRSLRLPFPGPALFSLAGLLFLFDRSFSIYGGNLASTMAGEFAFSMSLSIGVVYLGVLALGFESGRCRAWAAVLLALCGLCHLIPFIFVLVCTVLYLVVRPGTGRIRYVVTVWSVGGALTAFWTVPFVGRRGYMNPMGWERITSERYVNYLWSRERLDPQLVNSPDLRVVIGVAAVGLLLSLAFRRRAGVYLALVAVTFAVTFVLWPQSFLWNARLLPFYYLSLYLLAALGAAELCRLIGMLIAWDAERRARAIAAGGAVAVALGVLGLLLATLHYLPGTIEEDGSYQVGLGPISFTMTDRSFIDGWARWNFVGYEGLTTTASGVKYEKSYPEYHDLVKTMDGVSQQRGCGRAMWEHEEANDRYGTPMALMLLPFWTDGCVGSMEGLYFEASATTPYHFLVQDEVSWSPSNAQRQMPYGSGPPTADVFDRGVRHLQMMGVRYYLAINEQTQELADGHRSLARVAASGPWVVYEVADAPLVQGLPNRPAVLTDQPVTGDPWRDTSVCWWINPSNWDVVLTADGPPEWQRVARTHQPAATDSPTQKCRPAEDWGWFDGSGGPEAQALPPVEVTNAVSTEDGVSFDVDRPGVPVLVKVSYFPNWKVTGASGPYRATPNFMVVIPESTHVELRYGWTPLDLTSIALTLLGFAGVVWLARTRAVRVSPPSRFWGKVERPDLYPPPAPVQDLPAEPGPDPYRAGGQGGWPSPSPADASSFRRPPAAAPEPDPGDVHGLAPGRDGMGDGGAEH